MRKGTHHTEESKLKNRLSNLGMHHSIATEFKTNLYPIYKFKKGHITWNKGKTYEELKGIEWARKFKEKSGISNIGRVSSKKGKTLEEIYGTEKAISLKLNQSLSLKGRFKGKYNPYYGKPRSLSTIQKIKEKRALQILPVKDTKIEVKIQQFLKLLGMEFFTHQYIKDIEHGYQCDIFIPEFKVVIECDGNYWHKYPIRNDIDNIRTKELIEKGFKVLRLWEIEIKKMGLNDFEIKLKECIGNGY